MLFLKPKVFIFSTINQRMYNQRQIIHTAVQPSIKVIFLNKFENLSVYLNGEKAKFYLEKLPRLRVVHSRFTNTHSSPVRRGPDVVIVFQKL